MIPQATDELSCLPTESTDETEMYDYLPAFSSDYKPRRTVIECFECDETTPVSASDTKLMQVVASIEQESIITPGEFLKEQATDEFCYRLSESVGLPVSTFTYDQ